MNMMTQRRYLLFGPVHPWDETGDTYREDRGGESLRLAMAQNPFMHVLVRLISPCRSCTCCCG
jgi:hypothetical protein